MASQDIGKIEATDVFYAGAFLTLVLVLRLSARAVSTGRFDVLIAAVLFGAAIIFILFMAAKEIP